MMLWTKPENSYTTSDTWISQKQIDENVYSGIQRFVVVKESDRHCLCM